MFYHGSSPPGHDTTSSTIVLELTKGDDVAVVNLDVDTWYSWKSSGYLYGFSPTRNIR